MIVLLIWIAGLLTGTILSCACMCRKPEITDNTECLTDCNGCFGAADNDCRKCQERRKS